MNIKSAIPNMLTLGNLASGVIGIILTFEQNLLGAALFMILAAVLDFFDGLVARALGVSGELGKQLDSLADMVTFGVLPAVMLFHFISIGLGDYFVPVLERPTSHLFLESLGIIYALFAALRLAKFNIDENQSDSFIGVPSPAAALFVASFALVGSLQFGINNYVPLDGIQLEAVTKLNHWTGFDVAVVNMLFNPQFFIFISLFLSGMMVAPVTMLNFKFKEMSWAGNKARYSFLALAAFLILMVFVPYVIRGMGLPFLDYLVIPLIILVYMIFSLGVHFSNRNKA